MATSQSLDNRFTSINSPFCTPPFTAVSGGVVVWADGAMMPDGWLEVKMKCLLEARTITGDCAAKRFRLPCRGCPTSVVQDTSRSPTVGRCEARCLNRRGFSYPVPSGWEVFTRVPEPLGCVGASSLLFPEGFFQGCDMCDIPSPSDNNWRAAPFVLLGQSWATMNMHTFILCLHAFVMK